MMVVYELHLIRDRDWKIDSVFDDRDLAVMEGRRMEKSRRYLGVRVVEETFDQATNRTVSRTIYRSSRVETPHAEAPHQRNPVAPRGPSPVAPIARPKAPVMTSSAKKSDGYSHSQVFLVAALTVGAIFICGLGAIYALKALSP